MIVADTNRMLSSQNRQQRRVLYAQASVRTTYDPVFIRYENFEVSSGGLECNAIACLRRTCVRFSVLNT